MRSYTVQRDVAVPMRDGVVLHADVWLPDMDVSVPAILLRTPYDKSKLNPDFLRPAHCAEAGFAAVVQDTRGRFASGGDWQPAMWDQEGTDTYDTVEWIAQQSWCSGAVGMTGPSYLGIVQLVGAALKPPHLKAIAPAMATTAAWERVETGGAFRLDHVISWLAFMALDWLQKQKAEGNEVRPEHAALVLRAAEDPRRLMDERPLGGIALFKLPGFPMGFQQLLAAVVEPEGFDPSALAIPTLHVGGWYDIFAHATVGMFRKRAASLQSNADTVHLLMGCWAHARSLLELQGQVNFGMLASATAANVPQAHLAFFRRYLLGESLALPKVRYFLMNAGTWHDAASWPPAGCESRRYWLGSRGGANTVSGDGGLSIQRSSDGAAFDEYTYDPADPPPTLGGRILSGSLAPGPIDQTPLQRRSDVVCYTSDPLDASLDLTGPVVASLVVSSSAVDTDFIAKLTDVDAQGIALPVCEGIVRARWRRGFDVETPLDSHVPERINIDLGDVAWRVQPGHRLRLQVQSASFPHFDPNMNTGRPVGTDAGGVAAINRVFHDRERTSWLDITVSLSPSPAGRRARS